MVFSNVYDGFVLRRVRRHGRCNLLPLNGGEPYDLSFASLGCKTGLEWSSCYVFVEMMLAFAPGSTFMMCYCLLILMFNIVLGYSF